jgi:hypothetical protein
MLSIKLGIQEILNTSIIDNSCMAYKESQMRLEKGDLNLPPGIG